MKEKISMSSEGIEPEMEISQYIKKRKSNISSSKSKSNHKHKNKECLLIKDNEPYIASYCEICGKIRNWDVCREKREGYYIQLSKEAVLKIIKI